MCMTVAIGSRPLGTIVKRSASRQSGKRGRRRYGILSKHLVKSRRQKHVSGSCSEVRMKKTENNYLVQPLHKHECN